MIAEDVGNTVCEVSFEYERSEYCGWELPFLYVSGGCHNRAGVEVFMLVDRPVKIDVQ